MSLVPPVGCRMSITTDDGHPVIVTRYPHPPLTRYLAVPVCLVGLMPWSVGLGFMVSAMVSGRPSVFEVLVLAGWTLGGAGVVYEVILILMPSVPETLGLWANGVTYDSGIPPFRPPLRWVKPNGL